VAAVNKLIAVRDSKDPNGPVLVLNRDQWHAMRRRLRSEA